MRIFILITLFFSINSLSQNTKEDSVLVYGSYIKYKVDTVRELQEIVITDKFKTRQGRNYYYWFRKRVLNAYPYSKIASERLDSLNMRLSKVNSEKKRKDYIKLIQNYMEGEFTDKLKNLTKTEGRVLIKLIYRQTGKTVYDQIKELRSGWNAFWYNVKAKIFNLSLKYKYNPENILEDYLIEYILLEEFYNGTLVAQKPKVKFTFPDIPPK